MPDADELGLASPQHAPGEAETEAVRYLGSVALAVPLAMIMLRLPGGALKEMFMLAAGLAMSWFCCDTLTLQCNAALSAVVYGVVGFLPDALYPHVIVFVITLVSLGVYFAVGMVDNVSGSVFLVLVWRLCSLAFEVRGAPIKGQGGALAAGCPRPSPLTFFSYAVSFPGLVVGPVLAYRDYVGYIQQNPTSLNAANWSYWKARLKYAAVVVGIGFAMKEFFPQPDFDTLKEGWSGFGNAANMYLNLAISMAAIRFTYYTMWMLSEQAFILGGIGTTGSSGEEFDQEQTMAIDPYEIEIGCTAESNGRGSVQHIVRFWNMSVQRWLITIIYKRFPIKAFRQLALFLTIAFMHGKEAGYYIFFLNLGVLSTIEAAFAATAWGYNRGGAYRVAKHFILFRAFEYMVVPFHMRFDASIANCMAGYQALGYFGHIVCAAMLIATFIAPNKPKSAAPDASAELKAGKAE